MVTAREDNRCSLLVVDGGDRQRGVGSNIHTRVREAVWKWGQEHWELSAGMEYNALKRDGVMVLPSSYASPRCCYSTECGRKNTLRWASSRTILQEVVADSCCEHPRTYPEMIRSVSAVIVISVSITVCPLPSKVYDHCSPVTPPVLHVKQTRVLGYLDRPCDTLWLFPLRRCSRGFLEATSARTTDVPTAVHEQAKACAGNL